VGGDEHDLFRRDSKGLRYAAVNARVGLVSAKHFSTQDAIPRVCKTWGGCALFAMVAIRKVHWSVIIERSRGIMRTDNEWRKRHDRPPT